MTTRYILVEIDADITAVGVKDLLARHVREDIIRTADVTALLRADGADESHEVETGELQARGFARGWETLADRMQEELLDGCQTGAKTHAL